VFRQAGEQLENFSFDPVAFTGDVSRLTDESEIALVRKIAEYPRLVEAAAQALEPHRLAFYLYDLASAFHAQWNRGTENPDLRFVKVNDPQLTNARLGLVQAVSEVLTSGLGIVGAEAPVEMR
jgi:arginyl-tRNA synthetase